MGQARGETLLDLHPGERIADIAQVFRVAVQGQEQLPVMGVQGAQVQARGVQFQHGGSRSVGRKDFGTLQEKSLTAAPLISHKIPGLGFQG